MTDSFQFYHSFIKKPTILIIPLDWGLGHATRCIPLIRHLLTIGCEVIIGSEGRQRALLKQEFPSLQQVNVHGYRLQYGKNCWLTQTKLFLQIPKILLSVNLEHKWLGKFLIDNKVDAVISDNRYGLFSRSIPCVFISHQLTIKTPFGGWVEKQLRKLNYSFIEKFSECWIPDFEGNTNFGGELSHPGSMPAIPVRYLGRLSRITINDTTPVKDNELLILLSGPEPQRSILENLLLQQLEGYTNNVIIVRGLPGEEKPLTAGNRNVVIHNHLSSASLNKLIDNAGLIISRSGYSTVMDIIGLNKKCIFIPTPGQPEQLYLARYLEQKKLCLCFFQHNFSLEKALQKANNYIPSSFIRPGADPYPGVVEAFITRICKLKSLC